MSVRILAVEDSPTQAAALRAALETGGHSVTEAGSGEAALEALATGTFDVVVSDVVMPGSVDGYELCRRVKREHPSLPVVLLTSLADPLDIIRGLEAGADNFLTKPYTAEHLLERIGVLLATRRSRTRGRVQAGVSVQFMDREFVITSEREQILDLLVTTFEDAVRQNLELRQREEEIVYARERLARMYDIAVALNHCTTEEQVIDAALDGALRLPRVCAVWLSLREGASGFRLAGERNLPPALAGPRALEGDCRCRRMLVAGELDSVTNILECERIARAGGDAQGPRFHASVPLHCGGQTIGVLNLLSDDDTLFDEDDRTILYGIGSQVGFALERASLWRELERRVEERTSQLRLSDSILKRVGNLVLVLDTEGCVVYVSPSVEGLLGFTPEEVMGEGWWGLPWADDGERVRIRGTLAEPADHSALGERALRARDGAEHWMLFEESRGPGGLIIRVGHDITERKRFQEQFLQAQKMEAVGRLAGGIAHDFNNILTSILITTELLLPSIAHDDVKKVDIETIHGSAKRAAALTQQLLAFSRRQVLKPKVVNLTELFLGMEGMLRSLLGEDVAIETLLAGDVGNVRMDPHQMEQVIMNLVVNARDALRRGGRILIETKNVDLNGEYVRTHAEARSGPHVLLSVTDNGEGMDPDVMEHIFEPFFTTKGAGKGTGLGLATVHGIVRQSGGHIWVYSEPGRGTTFKIYLPRVFGAAEPSALAPSSAEGTGGSETILLVEDDEAVRRATERLLRSAGYRVTAVEDAATALAAVEAGVESYDLLITDVVMPGMTGPKLAERLATFRPDLRVLFMSGYSDEVVSREGMIVSGQYFIEKPFVVAGLLDRIREVLQVRRVSPPDAGEADAG